MEQYRLEPYEVRRDELDGDEINDRFAWQDHANCRGADPDLFFPPRGASNRKAKAMCAACVVRAECLEFAITEGERFGLWGVFLTDNDERSAGNAPGRRRLSKPPNAIGFSRIFYRWDIAGALGYTATREPQLWNRPPRQDGS